jgi:hypothetical protein
MAEKFTITIYETGKVETWRDGEWTILMIEDGSGAKTTVSLNVINALCLASCIHGSAVSAAATIENGGRTT